MVNVKYGLVMVGLAAMLATFTSAVPLENEISDVTNESFLPIKNIAKCAEDGGITGVMNCAAMRALKSLEQISKKQELEIIPGISLNNDNPNIQRVGKELSDEELPKDPQEKANKLYELLLENSAGIVSGRTLKIKMPQDVVETMSRALEEGRPQLTRRKKKKKGGMGSFMLGMGAKLFTLVPAIVGAVGLLATKALIVAKIALVLSVIVFFQYMAGKGSSLLGGWTGYSNSVGSYPGHGFSTGYGSNSYSAPTWTTNSLGGGSSQYPYARSIDVAPGSTNTEAQQLAYSASKKQV